MDYQRTYAELADEELLALAVELDELTEEARSALWGELSRRGLEEEATRIQRERQQKEVLSSRSEKLVTVARFDDMLIANLAKTKLESAGINCFLIDEHMVRMSWFYSLAVGRIKLQVRQSDVGTATEVLRADERDSAQEEG